jgi:poly(hydroxyalkanoate) granule-associated protein
MPDQPTPGNADANTTGADASRTSASANPFDPAFAGAFKASAQQIWLAGMGAFAKAQAEGAKMFDTLVKEGSHLQRNTQAVAEERLGEAAEKLSALASEVGQKAGTSWDKLEGIFEARTAKALNKLGIPTAQDLQALTERIDALAAAVHALGKAPARKPHAAKATAATTAAKRVRPRAKPPAD